MEGLRGIAVLLVFLVHIQMPLVGRTSNASLSRFLLDSGWRIGHCGVEIFFVLSGYLIYGAVMRRHVPYGKFMKRRAQRIYPAFLAVFVLYILISFAVPTIGKLPPGPGVVGFLVANLLLLPGVFPIEPLVSVAWTLSFEMFFYLLIPLVVTGLGLRTRSRLQRVVLFCLIGTVIVAATPVIGPTRARMFLFIVGVLVHEAKAALPRGLPTPRMEWALLGVGVIGLALAAVLQGSPVAEGVTPEPSTAAAVVRSLVLGAAVGPLVLGCLTARGVLHRFFSLTWLRWLGNMSYSYYLVHSLAIKAGDQVLSRLPLPAILPGPVLLLVVAVFFVGTLVASTVLFVFVERPLSLAPSASPASPARARVAH